MQFFTDFLLVVNSISDQQQKKYPSERVVIFTFILSFFQRISLLFPEDGYNQNIYQDVYTYSLMNFLRPFNVISILEIWDNAILIYSIILLIALINILMISLLLLLTHLYRLQLYDPLYPKGIPSILSKIVYDYIIYLEYLLYIPMLSVLIGFMNCGTTLTSNCPQVLLSAVSIIAIIFLFLITFISVYFFRTNKYWPENFMRKKYSIMALWIPIINFAHILLNNQYGDGFNNVFRLILANIMGLLWIFELYYVSPFIKPLNKIMFHFALFHEVMAILITLSIGSNSAIISQDNLTIFSLFYGILTLLLFEPIMEHYEMYLLRKYKLNQFEIISLVQLMNYYQKTLVDSGQKIPKRNIFLWSFALINHYQTCVEVKCQQDSNVLFKKRIKETRKLTRSFAKCVLTNELIVMRQKKNSFYEPLELFYISFQNDECNDSLPAFCQLKLYQQKDQLHSFYFQCMKESLNLQLKNKILQQQKNFQRLISNDIAEKQLSTEQIYSCDLMREKYMVQFQDIINLKITYWVNLLNGYKHILYYSNQIELLSNKLRAIKVSLETDLNINLNDNFQPKLDTNVLILKLLSIYFAMIINDYEYCLVCEEQIDEILRTELSFSPDLVFNANILKDQVVLISISTMKNRGQLIYKNKLQISEYFGYKDLKDFDNVKHVNQLMPQFVQERHDQILANFLSIGSSDRFVKPKMLFLKDSDGFLFPANQKIQNFFESTDDYILTAEFNKVRQFNDFILFDNSGQILGVTKNLCELLTKDGNNQNLKVDTLCGGYIFLLIPSIINMIQKHHKQLNIVDNEAIQLDEQSVLNLPNNFTKMSEKFNQYISTRKIHTNKTPNKLHKIFQTQVKSSRYELSQSSRYDESTQNHGPDTIQNCPIQLLNKEYSNSIEQFFCQNQSYGQKDGSTQHIIRNIIEFRKIGIGENIFPFFFLEITDIKHSNSNDNQFTVQTDTINEDNTKNPDLNSNSYLSHLNDIEIEKIEQKKIQYDVKPLDNLFKHLQEDYISKNKLIIEDQASVDLRLADISEIQENQQMRRIDLPYLNDDFAKFSQIVAPILKRPNFVLPASHQSYILEDYSNIELDFKNLQESQSFNLNSNNQSKLQSNQDQFNSMTRRGPQQLLHNIKESMEDFDINEIDPHHHSSKKNENSHQIHKIIDKHRRDVVLNEPEVNQSNSSRTSMTAKRGTLDIIKGIRNKQKFHKYLVQISMAYFILVLFVLITVIISVVENDNNARTLINKINNIIEPQKYCHEYATILIFGWMNLARKLNILGLSNYLEMQMMNQTQFIKQSLTSNMLNRYQIFAHLQDEGLLETCNISLVDKPKQYNQDFSVFYFLTLDKMNAVLDMDFTVSQPDKVFVMDLIFLRQNLGQLILVNQDLIQTIATSYQSDIKSINLQVVVQFATSFALMTILVFFPLILWKKYQSSQQRILMFVSRIHQNSAQQMLLKYLVAKDIIQQNVKTRWKFFNYFDLMYRAVEENEYDNLKMDLRDYKQILFSENIQKNKKSKNSNSQSTLLSSRIKQTTLRGTQEIIFTIILFIFLMLYFVGGYIILVNQAKSRAPSEALILQLVEFNNQYDVLMVSGILVKTQFLVYPVLIQQDFFKLNKVETISNINIYKSLFIVNDFLLAFKYTQKTFFTVWKDIFLDTSLQSSAQTEILNLFKISLCIDMYWNLPFCQLTDMGLDTFKQNYGFFDESDNNQRLVNMGLISTISNAFVAIKQSFNFELLNSTYLQNTSTLQTYVQSKEFNNVFLSYFLDYNKAFALIQDKIVVQIRLIILLSSSTASLYFLLVGCFLIITMGLLQIFWLQKKNHVMSSLRMGITNIPIEVLFEPQMMLMLKKLDRE